ncbi:MAG: thioredoxin-disulfide reductase [Armatimonadota bacterium]|nr:thioredoxin-disulfide reductase [Armatimonadota bacterium]
MSEVREHELVVIGGGAAGLTAGIYAVRYGLDVVLLTVGAPGGQTATATTIENFPGFPEGITGAELIMRLTQQAESFGVVMENAEVTSIRSEGERWRTISAPQEYLSTAVILAVGAHPRHLKIPGERELFGRGVSYCATCDGFFYRDETVAVIGGGDTAAEEALYMANIAKNVYLVHRRDELRATEILAERVLRNGKVEVIWDSVPSEIRGDDEVTSVILHNRKTGEDSELEVSGVFVAIGYEPNTEFLGDLVELEDGFIVTDERMRTSQPGIFACGDVRDTPLRQVATAVGDAAIAADSAYHYISEGR